MPHTFFIFKFKNQLQVLLLHTKCYSLLSVIDLHLPIGAICRHYVFLCCARVTSIRVKLKYEICLRTKYQLTAAINLHQLQPTQTVMLPQNLIDEGKAR